MLRPSGKLALLAATAGQESPASGSHKDFCGSKIKFAEAEQSMKYYSIKPCNKIIMINPLLRSWNEYFNLSLYHTLWLYIFNLCSRINFYF
jgi:hypothetical protein